MADALENLASRNLITEVLLAHFVPDRDVLLGFDDAVVNPLVVSLLLGGVEYVVVVCCVLDIYCCMIYLSVC